MDDEQRRAYYNEINTMRLKCLEAAVSHVNGLLASGGRPSVPPLNCVIEAAAEFLKYVNPEHTKG
jgi:hypothetical protein